MYGFTPRQITPANSMVLLSVITVTYNDAKGFLKTAESIFPFLCDDIEWIVKDGGSPNPCLSILKDSLHGIPVIFDSSPDKGVYDAMNTALDYASGQWVVFANGGDIVYIDRCLTAIHSFKGSCFAHANKFILAGSTLLVFPSGLHKGSPAWPLLECRKLSSARMSAFHQSQLYSRSLYQSLRFRTYLSVSADHAFFWDAVSNGALVEIYPYVFSSFYLGGLSTFSLIRSSRDIWFSLINIQKTSLIFSVCSMCRRVLGHLALIVLFLLDNARSKGFRL